MSKKLKLLLNIGKNDLNLIGGLDKTKEGEVVSVTDEQAKIMIGKGWAEPVGSSAVARADEEADEEESPLSDTNAEEAIEKISRMRSVDRLREIVDTDQRVSVKRAAQDRLTAIESGQ